ncbi:uncharacterized protein L969DRAFT_45822 [Mixia osmundae IAM 14324]|uniref:Mitochondrial proton/calcium exchanger protein n=1 Tax=Mixia osmundae (strain CBS 9802 / IAM 14324 / JCM 22182 / KY 12970) TaxID=764103 RepID=G7E5T4_MIXOS|nr:uncharacterized protein L969DRAFT_45822 [Mixia osmundae IAM 14324]KEI40654.1 hypothetical protein L969DRAFT_45822 [Mixia osmundae IAM 14324]GAA98194.1 hypothetical protein E5Q_04877 [Mixia osmundae IAM 14324]
MSTRSGQLGLGLARRNGMVAALPRLSGHDAYVRHAATLRALSTLTATPTRRTTSQATLHLSVGDIALRRGLIPARRVGRRRIGAPRWYSSETQPTTPSSSGPPPFKGTSNSSETLRSETKAAASTSKQAAPSNAEEGVSEKAEAVDPPAKKESSSKAVDKPKAPLMTRIWTKVKTEASHYWHGTKLLGKEIAISARLQKRLLQGHKLTRREKRQLKRTTQDLLRLIPFSVFLIVPFMELLLPVALKLFPNMLPSTFEDKYKEEEKKRKLLKVRLEMAKFLQETLRETGMKSADKIRDSEEFKEFFRKVRSTGESPSTTDIVTVARLFEEDLTLDNLSRPQLVSMCRYMNINAFGTDNFLRYTIRNRMAKLRKDDEVIDKEGIEHLSDRELAQACQSRGIRTGTHTPERLRDELGQWIDLHVHREMSGTLLILSKAFSFKEDSSGQGHLMSLKDTLASLPDYLLSEAELKVASDSASYKQRLDVLKQQEELIEDEREQEEREAEERKAKKDAEEAAELEAEEAEREKATAERGQAEEMLPEQQVEASQPDKEDVRMSKDQVHELGEALSILSAKSSVLAERQDLARLMEENNESGEEAEENSDSASASLAKRVKSMITKIDKQLQEFDEEVGSRMNLINMGPDNMISAADLRKALKAIKHTPDDASIDILIEKLDVDHDQRVPLEHVLALAQDEGLGIVLDEESTAQSVIGQSRHLRAKKDEKGPRKEDIVSDE